MIVTITAEHRLQWEQDETGQVPTCACGWNRKELRLGEPHWGYPEHELEQARKNWRNHFFRPGFDVVLELA